MINGVPSCHSHNAGVFEDNDVTLEELMMQLLISKGFARLGETSDAVAAAIQLCCNLAPHIANAGVPAKWN